MCFIHNKLSLRQKAEGRLKQLTAASELATTEYTIAKVVKAEDFPSIFKGQIGDRKILYSCKIYLKAGIDLEKWNPDTIEVNELSKSISITLPHAELLSFNMPVEEQKLEYEKVGILRQDFKAGERNELLKQGEDSVREEIVNMGILDDAERNTRDIFKASLLQLGYQTVNIKFA